MATVFRDPLVSTPRSPPKPGPTFISPGLAGLLANAGLKPFKQDDWPVPRSAIYPAQTRTYLHPAQTRLIGQDTFFGTKGKAPNYDWPLPNVRPYPIDNRTWLQSYDWGNLGKDTFFGSPGYAPDYDWPLPRTAPYPLVNRTGISGRVIAPIFPFVQSDWPLAKTHRWDFRQGEVSGRALGPGAMPFGQGDWPLATTKQYRATEVGQNLLALNQPTQAPFSQLNWPNPTRAVRGQTWTWAQQLDQPQMFGAAWPVPIPKVYRAIEVSQNLLALYQVQAPFTQFEWPTPRTTKQAPQDVPQNYLVRLTPQGLAPFTPQDWPLPRTLPFRAGITSGRAIGLTVQAPFTQLDWPLPRRNPYQSVQDISGLLPSAGLQPFASQDWPTPRSIKSVAANIPQSLLGLYQVVVSGGQTIFRAPLIARLSPLPGPASFTPPNLLDGLLVSSGVAPFTPQDWPLPRTTPFRQAVTSGRAIGLVLAPTPFSQFDWPNPQRVGLAARTWTWSTLLPPQVQITLPFAQTDWPLTKKIYFKQGEVSGRAIGTTVVATPFVQQDWPLPGRPPFNLPYWYTIRYEIEPGPFGQLDWPLPKSVTFKAADMVQNPLGLYYPPLRPFPQFDWPLPRSVSVKAVDIVQNPLGLYYPPPRPFFQSDWPNPRKQGIIDATWIRPTPGSFVVTWTASGLIIIINE